MKRKNLFYLKHIRAAINDIDEFTDGVSREDFFEDKMVRSAVIRQLEIIGEASNKLTKELQQDYSHIPWHEIIGMRNKLIHEYFGVDLESVWETIKKDLPSFKAEIASIISNLE